MRRLRILAALSCWMALGLMSVNPTEAQTLGTIQGEIVDDSSAPLPGVTVKITNVETGVVRTAFADANGFYKAPSLPSGIYSVEASMEGMQTTKQDNIRLFVGQALDVKFTLKVSQLAEAITVTSEAPVIEVSRSSAAKYVSQEEIANLPIAGRDFTDFALLTPTVKSEPSRGGVSLSGQRGVSSGLNIDGTEAKSAFFGYGRGGEATENDGVVISQDSVKEFQVITNGFAPEYGRNGGGYINVITKSGTNELKGTGFFFFRGDKAGGLALVSDIPISELKESKGLECSDDPNNPNGINCTPKDFKRYNWGATLGGPIIKDKTHFFASYDQVSRTDPFIQSLAPGIYDAVKLRAAQDPRFSTLVDGFTPNGSTPSTDATTGRTATAQFQREVSNIVLFGKIDHQLSEAHSLSLRYNFTDYERKSSYQDEESRKLEKAQSLVGQVVSVLNDKAVNEFRFQYAKDNLDRLSVRVGQPIEAQIRFLSSSSSSNNSVGKFDFLPINVKESKLQLQDNFSYMLNDHELKFGFDFQSDHMEQLFAQSKDGRYDFLTPQDFVDNKVSAVRIYFGDSTYPNYSETQSVLGFYAQDAWKFNSNLTFNLGLRWDGTFNPHGIDHLFDGTVSGAGKKVDARDIPNDLNNIAPRFGFAYTLGNEGKAVLRGGAGLFYSRTPSLIFANQVQSNGLSPNYGRVTLRPGQTGYADLGQPIDNENPPSGIKPAVSYVDPDFEDPGTWRFNLGYEREVIPNWTMGLDAVYAHGFDLASNIEINRTLSKYDQFGRPIYSSTRPDSNYDEIFTRQSLARSNYMAATLSVNKRFANGYQVQAHYTYAQDKDNDDNERDASAVTLTDANNPDYDYAFSSRDIKHRFVLSGLANLPFDFKLSGIVNVQSGTPWTAIDPNSRLAGYPASNGPNGGRARAVINGVLVDRNSFRNDATSRVDIRLTKLVRVRNIQMEAFAEVFNVLNQNVYSVGGSQREPTKSDGSANADFGLGDSALLGDQRQAQVGARISF